ncbi:MAG: hypothetical protein ACR652_00425 [Methylocystis sp.]|uniref:hypothetical protein n=1 Tax=Methylocystis sp. TaxID=1911079 RepID=UPI003DA5466D
MVRPLEFARTAGNIKAPCYNLVAAWLRHHGAPNVPSESQARRRWIEDGSEAGARWAAAQIGLVERLPRMSGDVCLIAQRDAEPLLGIVLDDGFSVARAFGRMFVGRAHLLVSWGLPCRQS